MAESEKIRPLVLTAMREGKLVERPSLGTRAVILAFPGVKDEAPARRPLPADEVDAPELPTQLALPPMGGPVAPALGPLFAMRLSPPGLTLAALFGMLFARLVLRTIGL